MSDPIDAAQAAIDKLHDQWKGNSLIRRLAESMCADAIRAYDLAVREKVCARLVEESEKVRANAAYGGTRYLTAGGRETAFKEVLDFLATEQMGSRP